MCTKGLTNKDGRDNNAGGLQKKWAKPANMAREDYIESTDLELAIKPFVGLLSEEERQEDDTFGLGKGITKEVKPVVKNI